MSKATPTFVTVLAALGLALAPAAAQAKTRASDNQARYTPAQIQASQSQTAQSQPGQGRAAQGEKIASSGSFLAGLLVGLWVSGIIVIVADLDDDDNQSPGAN